MNITIFGASGKTGLLIVEKALVEGHKVKAYVRRADAISSTHPNLITLVGNLNDTGKLEEAIQGADACISTLGGSSLKKPSVEFTEGVDRIVSIMEKQKVNRLIYLSSIGAGESRYFMSRPVRFLVADVLLRIPLADHSKNEKRIMGSSLHWSIIRPGGLTDGDQKDELNFGSDKTALKGNPKISRASVAAFILNQVNAPGNTNNAFWLYE